MELLFVLIFSGTIRGIAYIVSKYISQSKGSAHAMALANFMIDLVVSLPIGIFLFISEKVEASIIIWTLALISAAMYGISHIAQYAALKRIDMSVLGIVLRLNIVFTSIIGILVLGEELNPWNYLGILIIFLGNILVISRKGKFDLNLGIIMGILAAVMSAGASVLDKYILDFFSSGIYVTVNALLITITMFMIKPRALPEALGLIRSRPLIFLLFSFLNISAWYLAAFVLQNMDVAKFTPVQKSITLVIPVLSGILIFKEREQIWQKIIGLVLAMCGIGLMYV